MLTVDFDRLELGPEHRLLDIGAGFGRHAYEGVRRGASVVACDLAVDELVECAQVFAVMAETGEAPATARATATRGDTTLLPFPDAAFDRIIAAEILEHIPDHRAAAAELFRVLRPGGRIAVSVPATLPERICWRLSSDYHAPTAVGGHVRIYTIGSLTELLSAAGFTVEEDTHRAHALHAPYWWLKCAVGVDDDDHPLVAAYHRLLVWDIVERPTATRVAERMLDPVLGKSLVIYARRPDNGDVVPNVAP